jgi:2-dehydropantoate 2-reductase
MRLLIVGAGGIGGYFGAQFVAHGHDVTFLARGSHLAAMRERGLTVESAVAPARLPVNATDNIGEAGRPDVILMCTKLADLEAAAEQIAPLSGAALVVTLQNGVDAPAIVGRHVSPECIAPGVAHIAAAIKAPGVIAHTGTLAKIRVGTVAGGPSVERVDALVATARACGIDIERVDDVERTLWEKFVFLVAMSGLTCLARQPIGVVREDADLRATLLAAMNEVAAVGRARGVTLAPDFVARQLAFVDALPAQMRSSMLNDLTAGRRLEAPWLAGAVVRMAAENRLDVPVNHTIYAALKPYLGGGRPA